MLSAITRSSVAVGIAELHVATSGEIVAHALGSCVAICLYDSAARVAGMAHVLLPTAPGDTSASAPAKFADTAVPALLDAMAKNGARSARLRGRLVGGAAVLHIEGYGLTQIGQRTLHVVRAALARAGVPILAEATGGVVGRTARMDAQTGRVFVRTLGAHEVEL